MYGRANSPALKRVSGRQMVRQIHWRSIHIPADWFSAHRASQIDARVNEARERAIRRQIEVGRRCGY